MSISELAKESQRKQEENVWAMLEEKDRQVTVIGHDQDIRDVTGLKKTPLGNLWNHLDDPTHDTNRKIGYQSSPYNSLERKEREIIAALERDELERQKREAELEDYIDPWKVHNLKPRRINGNKTQQIDNDKLKDVSTSSERREESSSSKTEENGRIVERKSFLKEESKVTVSKSSAKSSFMKNWKSMEQLKSGLSPAGISGGSSSTQGLVDEISRQVSKDAEWSPEVHSSWRFFDLESERKRMEEWDREQERKRQVLYTQHTEHAPIFPL